MAAVVKDDEGSDEKKTSEHGQWDAQEKRNIFDKIKGNPYAENRDKGVDQLPDRSTEVRDLELCDKFLPLSRRKGV